MAEGVSSFGCCEHGNDILNSMAGMEYLFVLKEYCGQREIVGCAILVCTDPVSKA